MKLLEDIPGMKEELELVGHTMRECVADSLGRQPLSKIIEEILASDGKYLRPALVLLFGRFGMTYPACRSKLVKTAAVVELIHMASLIHDDIVDDAPSRRGRDTIQSAFGKDMAVYAGDYLLSCVLRELMSPEMLDIGQSLSRAMGDMCSGELGQYAAQFNVNTDENQYFMNISGKTAALFSAACETGAIASGCGQSSISASKQFGHSLGLIFQLRDDLLDCILSHEDSGKKQGMDFINGIYTLPVIYTFNDSHYGPAIRDLAARAKGMEPQQVFTELYSIVSVSGGVEYTRWIMRQYRERAMGYMLQLPSSPAKSQLSGVLDYLVEV